MKANRRYSRSTYADQCRNCPCAVPGTASESTQPNWKMLGRHLRDRSPTHSLSSQIQKLLAPETHASSAPRGNTERPPEAVSTRSHGRPVPPISRAR